MSKSNSHKMYDEEQTNSSTEFHKESEDIYDSECVKDEGNGLYGIKHKMVKTNKDYNDHVFELSYKKRGVKQYEIKQKVYKINKDYSNHVFDR